MAQAVLHVSAEHPQKKHISENVQKAPVQKHAGYQRHDRWHQLRSGMRQRSLGTHGYQAELPHQQISRARRQRELVDEHQKVRRDQQNVDDRKGPAWRFAA